MYELHINNADALVGPDWQCFLHIKYHARGIGQHQDLKYIANCTFFIS